MYIPPRKRALEQNLMLQAKRVKRADTNIDDLINKIVARYDVCNYNIADLFAGVELKRKDFGKKASVAGSKYNTYSLCALMFFAKDFNLFPEAVFREISLLDISRKVEDGPDKGKTALWGAVLNAGHGYSAAFELIETKFDSQLTLEDVKGKDGAETVLWLSAFMAGNRPKAFEFIIKKFGSQLTLEDFNVKNTLFANSISVFDLAAENVSVAKSVLAHTRVIDEKLNMPATAALYQAKGAFLSQLNQMDTQRESMVSAESLFDAAENAKKAGFQLSDIMLQAACNAKFDKAHAKAQDDSFDSKARIDHLSEALAVAVKMPNDIKRVQAIQNVANLYMVDGLQCLSKQELEKGLVPGFLMQGMHSQNTVEWAGDALNLVKKVRCLEEKNSELMRKLSFAESKKQALQQVLLSLIQNSPSALTPGFNFKVQQDKVAPSHDNSSKVGEVRRAAP